MKQNFLVTVAALLTASIALAGNPKVEKELSCKSSSEIVNVIVIGLPFAAHTRIRHQAEAPGPYSNLIAELYVFGAQQ